MKDQNCAYCMEGELVAAFGIKICAICAILIFHDLLSSCCLLQEDKRS